MARPPIDFWFSIGSMYTFLAVMRLPEVAAKSSTTFRWRPFSVRAIMIEMDNLPRNKPLKLAYMWRDLERRAQAHGIPYRRQPSYPLQNFDLANRIAVVGAEEGWCAHTIRAPPIIGGSLITMKPAAAATIAQPCARSARTLSALSGARLQMKSPPATQPPPTRRANWEYSARRHS